MRCQDSPRFPDPYVSNIYKYYVSNRLILEQQEKNKPKPLAQEQSTRQDKAG